MARNEPPQTIAEAIDDGWTALGFECRVCGHTGRLMFSRLIQRRHRIDWPIAMVFALTYCRKCGRKPLFAMLGRSSIGADGKVFWDDRRVEIYEGQVLRPTRG